jgi:hypothetical protein
MIKLALKVSMLLCMIVSASSDLTTDDQSYTQLKCIHIPVFYTEKEGAFSLNIPKSAHNQTLVQFVFEALLEDRKISFSPAKIHMFLNTRDLNGKFHVLTKQEETAFWSRVAERNKQIGQAKELSHLPLSFADILSPYFLILHVEEYVSKL